MAFITRSMPNDFLNQASTFSYISVNKYAVYDCIRNRKKDCRKFMTMRCLDILRTHCGLPGGSSLPFTILRALILDIVLQYIRFLGYR